MGVLANSILIRSALRRQAEGKPLNLHQQVALNTLASANGEHKMDTKTATNLIRTAWELPAQAVVPMLDKYFLRVLDKEELFGAMSGQTANIPGANFPIITYQGTVYEVVFLTNPLALQEDAKAKAGISFRASRELGNYALVKAWYQD